MGGEQRDRQANEQESFYGTGDLLYGAAPSNPAPLQEGKHQEHGACRKSGASGQKWEKHSQVLADNNTDQRNGANIAEPITPSDEEAGVIADGIARESIMTTTSRQHGCDLSRGNSTKQRVECSRKPYGEEQPSVRHMTGNLARRTENSCPNRVADCDGEAETDAQYAQQRATADLWSDSDTRSGLRHVSRLEIADAGPGSTRTSILDWNTLECQPVATENIGRTV